MHIRSVIIDDGLFDLRYLELVINRNFPEIEVIGKFQSAVSAKEFLIENTVDLVFLDASMPQQDGFDFISSFNDLPFEVVFVTGSDEHAIKAIKGGAIGYILKPATVDEIDFAVKRAVKVIAEKSAMKLPASVLLNYQGGKSVILLHEIIYMHGFDNLTTFYLTGNRRITVSKTLKHYESLSNNFFRIHKSYIVSIDNIISIESKSFFVKLKDGTQLPISRRNSKPLNQCLKKLCT